MFLALANSLNANIKKNQRITLGHFGSNAVDISWQQHRFLPEIPPQFTAPCLYLEIGNLSIEFNMENCAIVPNLRSKVKDNTNLFDEFNISFESENCFTLRSKQLNLKQSQEEAINLVKNYFCYSIYPNNASYLNIQPKEKQIPQILAYYGIIFILGDIVRYKPNVIYSLLEAKETSIRWFINKLCEHKVNWECEGLITRPQSFVRRGMVRRTHERVDTYTREQMEYYYHRFTETTQPQIKAIYGEIILDCEGAGKLRNKYEVFTNLIPTLLVLGKVILEQEEISYISYHNSVAGAVEWSLRFSNEKLLVNSIEEIISFISQIDEKYDYRWVLENSQTLLKISENKRFQHLLDSHIDIIISRIEKAKEFFWNNNNWLLFKPVCKTLLEYYKVWGCSVEKIRSVELEIGKSYEKAVETDPLHINKGGWYHKAIEYYISIGETIRLDELKSKMQIACRIASETEMMPIGVPVGPSTATEEIIEIYRKIGDSADLLSLMSCDPVLLIEMSRIKEMAQKNVKDFILSSLMPGVVLDDGRVVSRATNSEENLRLQVRRNYSFCLTYISRFLLSEILNILRSNSDCVAAIMNVYKEWDFVNKAREPILQIGFTKLMEGDYISALHILVPQFEACLREMFSAAGICTIVFKDGIYQEQVLNEFLKRDEVRDVLEEDMHQYIETVMVSQNGWNLRNNIAHGLVDSSMFTLQKAAVILHMYLRLFSFE